jgi:glycosyltransferase involved in cell wall biosynthesis
MNKRILVFGNFVYNNDFKKNLGGQTVKTRNVYELLLSKAQEIGEVKYFDTDCFIKNKFSYISFFTKLFKCKNLIYLPGQNNFRYLFPVIFLFCIAFRINIFYIVVGGWLDEFLANKKIHVFLLSKIERIYPQSEILSMNLRKNYGFNHVETLPNFRIQSFVPNFNNTNNKFKIVFFARITKSKGIDVVFRLADYIKIKYGLQNKFCIDFFGRFQMMIKYFSVKKLMNMVLPNIKV